VSGLSTYIAIFHCCGMGTILKIICWEQGILNHTKISAKNIPKKIFILSFEKNCSQIKWSLLVKLNMFGVYIINLSELA
jgi:hypothetical protein